MTQDPTPPGRRATIHDVAQRAGVAVGTVSRYLNGMPLRSGNRQQIEQAIADLGFRRNKAAAAIRTDMTHVVGLTLPSLSEFHAGLLEHLSRKMRMTGRAVMSFYHDLEPRMILEGLEFFASHQVDAVVMDGHDALTPAVDRLIAEGLVVVLYDNDMEAVAADRVFLDNRRTGRRLTEHLLDLGHVDIGVIHGNLRDSAARDRLTGCREAMEARGLTLRHAPDGRWTESGGYGAAEALLDMADPPTAIVSCNYNMTIGVLRCLQDRKRTLPHDLSLVSFDDVPAFSVHQPGITCAAQPVERMAETITSILSERLDDPAAVGRRSVRIDGDIILRGSTGRPRSGAIRKDGTWQR